MLRVVHHALSSQPTLIELSTLSLYLSLGECTARGQIAQAARQM